MSYHVKDLIAAIATEEKTQLLFNTLDLLDAINYIDHIKPIEDLLMTADNYAYDELLTLIEAILIVALIECCNEYGVYINDNNVTYLTLYNMYFLAEGVIDIICDDTKNLTGDTMDESDIKTRFIYLLESIGSLEYFTLNELIDSIDDNIMLSIDDNEPSVIIDTDTKQPMTRLERYPLLKPIVQLDDFIITLGTDYDFPKAFGIYGPILKHENDKQLMVSKFVALVMLSHVEPLEFEDTIKEYIGYLQDTEDAVYTAMAISKLREYINE